MNVKKQAHLSLKLNKNLKKNNPQSLYHLVDFVRSNLLKTYSEMDSLE